MDGMLTFYWLLNMLVIIVSMTVSELPPAYLQMSTYGVCVMLDNSAQCKRSQS